MSTMRKYTPSFGYAQQIAKEKLGRASNSVDSFETRSLKEKIHHIKHTLHNVKSAGLDYVDHMTILADKGTVFADALSSLGRLSLSDSTLGTTVCMVGDMVKNHSASTKASSMSTSSQVVLPLIKIYENELEEIISMKHDQERIRLQFEAQQARLKDYQKRGTRKLPAVEADTILVKDQYNKITQELSNRCDELITKMETTLMPSMQAYISFQAAFFANLTEQWKHMEKTMAYIPKMSELDHDGAGDEDELGAAFANERPPSRASSSSRSSTPAPAGLATM